MLRGGAGDHADARPDCCFEQRCEEVLDDRAGHLRTAKLALSEEDQMPERLLDAAGRRRSPATLPGFHAGRPPRNKGMRYPADPPTVEEIVAVMRAAGQSV